MEVGEKIKCELRNWGMYPRITCGLTQPQGISLGGTEG